MKKIGCMIVALCVSGLPVSSLNAQFLPYRLAQAGRPLKTVFLFSIDPDCRSRGRAIVAVVTPPEHGTLSTQEMMDFPNLAQTQSAFHCDRQKVPGTSVYYEGASGYAGSDRFTVQAQYPNGFVGNYTYNILVR